MELSKQEQRLLSQIQEAKGRHEDLAEILNFYEKLFHAQFIFKSRLRAGPWGKFLEEKQIQPAHVADGTPQITFDDLRMEEAPFFPFYQTMMELLRPYSGDPQGLEECPAPERILQYAREILERRTSLVGLEPSMELARTASGLVLAPFLQLAGECLMPRIDLKEWAYGHCPVCGGKPCLAALQAESGARTLLCCRCSGEWGFRRTGCPFCMGNDPQTYYPSADGKYRLYVCEACQGYLKTVVVLGEGSEVSLPVEAIVTVSMDIAAQQEGYKAY